MADSWFEKLKEFIKIDINLNNLINIQINNNNSSKQIDYSEEDGLLSINYPTFPPTGKNKMRDIAKGAQLQGVALLLNESQELLNDIKLKEAEPDIKSLLDFFRNKIPPDDYSALRAAIYVDKLAREGKKFEDIYRLKGDIGKRFGGRGYKICNLYSSGYFETMIKPLYEEYSQHGFDSSNLLKNYNIIINEEAFAIFVSGDMDASDVKTAIKMKIARNLKYGRRDVTIHGIGKINAGNIREAISDIEKEEEYSNIEKYIEETGSIILARVSF